MGMDDTYGLVPFFDDLEAGHRRTQRSNALLPGDEDLLVRRYPPALEMCAHGPPGDQVANRVSLVQRVDEISNFGTVPHEMALKPKNGGLLVMNVRQQAETAFWANSYFFQPVCFQYEAGP
jgi:hypothetical protein